MVDNQNQSRKRRTKSGEAGPPPSPPAKNRYNLRNRKEEIVWVDDDTIQIKKEDEEKKPEIEVEETKSVHGITLPKNVPVSVKIHIHTNADSDEEDEDYETESEEDDEDDDDDEDDEYDEDEDDDSGFELDEDDIAMILANSFGRGRGRAEPNFIILDSSSRKDDKKKKEEETPISLTRKEQIYFEDLPRKKSKNFLKLMKGVEEHLGETDVPFKFRVLEMNCSDATKAIIIRKVDQMNRMGMESGESQKLRVWVEAILRVPFGKIVPLPVTLPDGPEKCADFLKTARSKLDNATYGMEPAKMQIMQTLAQWISNPESVGNCIAMRGPPGVGKTQFARSGIAGVLNRPFMFFSLGGASDIAHYIGHSYTYEGSMWGRILDSIIQSKCMNPVLYFDELDKISGTPHGEEITSMLIHLTDRTQNSQYHDRYFSGIDFDLSKCLFVFSYNDESKVNPILKDRMTMIQCSGYKDVEKKIIVANYIWPEILNRVGIKREELSATEEAAEYIIREYSKDEEGMRSLIRIVETVVSRINLLRIDKEAEKYKFYTPIQLPMKLDVPTIQKLLVDYAPKEVETWRSFYN
jgi:ATP-dependent Lon protease